MVNLCHHWSLRIFGLVGLLLALSLTVVVPIHLGHRFSPACHKLHPGLRAAHHTVVDQLDGRLEARMDRAGRAEAPDAIAVARFFTSPAQGVLPRMTAGPPPVRVLRHLRVAPGHADDGDPPSRHTASLRV
jgi:hypothetical protein